MIFDNFDAETIFKNLAKPLRDKVRVGTKTTTRVPQRSPNLKTGWTWNWNAAHVISDGQHRPNLPGSQCRARVLNPSASVDAKARF